MQMQQPIIDLYLAESSSLLRNIVSIKRFVEVLLGILTLGLDLTEKKFLLNSKSIVLIALSFVMNTKFNKKAGLEQELFFTPLLIINSVCSVA
jgi:hypothetical protein